jgi:hypothetical protein
MNVGNLSSLICSVNPAGERYEFEEEELRYIFYPHADQINFSEKFQEIIADRNSGK